jgi:2-iminobutanoate/2-iminopropanoate deaminase
MSNVSTSTPFQAPVPIGPYSHIAKVGTFITIGGVAGVDPKTGEVAGTQVGAQTREILNNMSLLLESAASDLQHVVHVNAFLLRMSDFDEMNRVYAECMGAHRPARTVIGVNELPKPGVLLTMNLTAVTRD